jgi:hypothetical protein
MRGEYIGEVTQNKGVNGRAMGPHPVGEGGMMEAVTTSETSVNFYKTAIFILAAVKSETLVRPVLLQPYATFVHLSPPIIAYFHDLFTLSFFL